MEKSIYEDCEIRLTSPDGKILKISPNEIRIEGEFMNSYTTSAMYYGLPKIYYQGDWREDEMPSVGEKETSEELTKRLAKELTKVAMDDVMDFLQNQFYPTRVIYNPPYTICYFGDERIVVKCSEFDEFKPDFGVMACIMRRMFDSRAEFDRLVESGSWQEPKEKKNK